jgi:putative tryptophan/tyrosine transport system substrate-binding protein
MRRREFIALIGGAAAWPHGARAQQQALPVIGFLSGGAEGPLRSTTAAFHQGLGESGFIEGRNVEILYRWAETHNDRLPALAADLVRRRVAVIVATASPGAALAAKSALNCCTKSLRLSRRLDFWSIQLCRGSKRK